MCFSTGSSKFFEGVKVQFSHFGGLCKGTSASSTAPGGSHILPIFFASSENLQVLSSAPQVLSGIFSVSSGSLN
jgi:hypothetical protein